jgi:hypothetical protein
MSSNLETTSEVVPALALGAVSTPVLTATDVVKDLGQGAGKVRALKGVSLSLYPGELTLLMGCRSWAAFWRRPKAR